MLLKIPRTNWGHTKSDRGMWAHAFSEIRWSAVSCDASWHEQASKASDKTWVGDGGYVTPLFRYWQIAKRAMRGKR